jgi:hypothetical protein
MYAYAFMAEQNREAGVPVNPEIADALGNEARDLLAQGLSGTEVADRLGGDSIVQQNANQLLYAMGKDLPGRDEPLEAPDQPWDSQDYLNAKYAVIASLQEELTARDEEYASLIDGLLEDGFSYRDVLGDEAARAGASSEHPEHATAYAHELARLILAGRGEEVSAATQDIRKRFEDTRALLPESVQLSPYADSQSWILWDIGKQESLKDKDYPSATDAAVNYSGSVLDNPEETGGAKQTELMRNVVAWRHLGWEMHLKAFNGEDMSWLDPSLDEHTKGLLHQAGDEAHNGQLTSSEYTDLGRGIEAALRKQSGERWRQENPEAHAKIQAEAQQLLADMAPRVKQ